MKVEDIKWYSPFVLLAGAILSFADPITDILTLVEFYGAGHKTWFGVGLAFVILSCLVTTLPYLLRTFNQDDLTEDSDNRPCTQVILCCCNPFSVAFTKLEGFVLTFKLYYINAKVVPEDVASDPELEQTNVILQVIDIASLAETATESFPQFILQLYAMSVQEEPVEVIQMISLPISFLSLAWGITIRDRMLYETLKGSLKFKHKLAFYLPSLLFTASITFSYCFFMVAYKWWVIAVILFRIFAFTGAILYVYSKDSTGDPTNRKHKMRMIRLTFYCLYVLDNYVMILSYYFSQHSNTWYSSPVTICVCVFSVLGSVTRLIVYHFLFKKASNDGGDSTNNP